MRTLAFVAFVAAAALAWWWTAPTPHGPSGGLQRGPERPLDQEGAAPAELARGPVLDPPGAQGRRSEAAAQQLAAEAEPGARPDAALGASVLHGTAMDDLGAPLEGLWVVTIDAHGVRRNVRTRSNGAFAFADLAAGAVRLQANMLGWLAVSDELLVEDGRVLRHDLVLQRAPILRLRCGDGAGQRVRAMLAAARFSAPPTLDFAATVAEPGELLDPPHPGGNNPYGVGATWDERQLKLPLDDHPETAGVLVLRAPPPVWVSVAVQQRVLCKRLVLSTDDPVHLTLTVEELQRALAALRLAVVDDETGEPTRASVTLHPGSRSETAEDGTLALERLPAGPFDLFVEASGFVASSSRVTLEPARTLDLGVVRLRRPARIAGRVVDADGAPLLVEVVAEPLEGEVGPPQRHIAQSGAGGAFELPGLAPGRYVVRVRGDDEGRRPGAEDTIWTSPAVTVDTRLGPRADVVVVAEPPVSFRVEFPPEAAPLALRLVDEEGRALRRWSLDPLQSWSLEPRSLKLPRGRFELIGSRAEVEVGRWPLGVGPGPGALRVDRR